jgi:DNA-binding NarL/FixJ family response regulator
VASQERLLAQRRWDLALDNYQAALRNLIRAGALRAAAENNADPRSTLSSSAVAELERTEARLAAVLGLPAPAGECVSSDPLTPRERDVAALIARGLSNRQIARELVVTPGTVANHVGHILDRLGFSTRTQIAVWAIQSGQVAAAASAASGDVEARAS